jgi:hypothetical protein
MTAPPEAMNSSNFSTPFIYLLTYSNLFIIPMTDVLIVHLAKPNHLKVVSFDLYFDQVPGLKGCKPGD